MDGLVIKDDLKTGAINAAQQTLDFKPTSDTYLASDSTTTDEWFVKWFGRTKESSRELINNLQTAKNNAQAVYDNSESSNKEIYDSTFDLVRQNLLTLIDKAERKLVVYTGGSPGAWTADSKAAVNTAITDAKEVINRPSDSNREYLLEAKKIHTAVAGLKMDTIAL